MIAALVFLQQILIRITDELIRITALHESSFSLQSLYAGLCLLMYFIFGLGDDFYRSLQKQISNSVMETEIK